MWDNGGLLPEWKVNCVLLIITKKPDQPERGAQDHWLWRAGRKLWWDVVGAQEGTLTAAETRGDGYRDNRDMAYM